MSEGGKNAVRDAASRAKPLTRRAAAAAEPDQFAPQGSLYDLPKDCPVTPLGLSNDVRFYLDAKRQLAALPAKDHNRLNLLGLFGGDEFFYTKDEWKRVNDNGSVTGWRPEVVASDMIRACGWAGIWDASKRERGRGAWRGDDGELILHTGDRVLIFEKRPRPWETRQNHKPGLIGRYVYPSAEPAGAPADDPPPDNCGEQLYNLLESWNWKRGDRDAFMMMGWIGAAFIGGALAWRPAVWLTGGKGTGKSTLQGVIKHLFGDQLIDLADTSPAFIWQSLGRQTLPVDVDELEADEDNRKQLAVVKLARLAASGGQLGRGSDRHVPVSFTLRSCFLFSSVLIPPLMGPDRSRMAILDLRDLPRDQPAPAIDPRALRRLGSQLRRRMIDCWDRFDDTLEWYRRALAEGKHSARGQDQFGTLLACADLLFWGGEADEDARLDLVRRMTTADMAETSDDMLDEEQCLNHLLGAPIAAYKQGEMANLGEWINRALGRFEPDQINEARRICSKFGVRIETRGGETCIAVANQHGALQTIYEGTRWRTAKGTMGVWVQALRRLNGAEAGQKALYFGGPVSKAILLPASLVPEPDRQPQLNLP